LWPHTEAIAPETLADRLQQNEMQRAAVDEKLAPVIAREHAARLALNELAMPVVERQLTRRHRCLCWLILEGELGKLAYRMGKRLMPTPTALISDAASNTRHVIPTW
jgi:hypothetical protein